MAPRKIPAGQVAFNLYLVIYVLQDPQVWSAFLAWMRATNPAPIKKLTDEQAFDAAKEAGNILEDLLYGGGAPTGFLTLRPTALADAAGHMLSAVSSDPPANVSVGLADDCGGMTGFTWLAERESAMDLIAALRERLGSPDQEAVLGESDTSEIARQLHERGVTLHDPGCDCEDGE